jgi:uncharacterized protein DUF2851
MLFLDCYAELQRSARVKERALFPLPRCPGELEIQARWFAGEFGRSFISTTGEKVELAQLGTWNREAGPDFRDAAIRIDGGRAQTGCIEIDLTDRSWETHGHSVNPAFEDTVLHVFVNQGDRTFFSRTLSNRNVPQVRLDLSKLSDAFNPVPLARPGRCHSPLKDLAPERVQSILRSAAEFRLQKKARRLQTAIECHGRDEALFHEIATALGYKENKLPFNVLAQRVTLKPLRQDALAAESLLFGFGGFLEAPDLAAFPAGTRDYVRTLWDRWWPYRDEMRKLVLPRETWRITGTRPLNHPHRRLAALAVIVTHWSKLCRAVETSSPERVRKFFGAIDHPFWRLHYTLASEPAAKAMALLGDSRIDDILANVCFPLWSISGDSLWPEYGKLPARLTNRRVETAATRLFGPDSRRKDFMKTVAHQQGLLQIYEDFCLQDDSDCANCPFPEQMRRWH